ncbi:MAG TPA: DUF4384 domain-containing protein [Nitrospira sp.]|nr:DUF4384 domain-containing protein [Nitrospira sp.]
MRRPSMWLFMGILLLSSCAAAPFLIPAAIEFARNMLVTSNKNYGGKYSADMNQMMMRLSTPYVAMGLPPGTPQTALIPPTMLQQQQQQQQAMMNQQMGQMPGQFGQGMPGQPGMGTGMPGAPMDPYSQTGGPNTGFGQQPGVGYGMQGAQPGYQGQQGYYDPNNPYMPPGTNIQAPAYGMQQFNNPYGSQYGQVGAQPYGQMGGYFQQPNYPPQGMPLQPGYPAAAPGSNAPAPMPGYPMQGMPGYQQQGMGNQAFQQPMMQQPMMQGYPQQGMQPFQQQQMTPNYQQPVAASPYGYSGQMPTMGAGYPGQIYPRSVAGPPEPVTLDVALVRQAASDKGKEVKLIHDGETLRGEKDGDRFKIIVRTNCECFVYIISVDGSGWAQPVFPIANGTVSNPIKPETEQAFPEGQYWYQLDQYKGIETFFFVASPARRTDIEESFAQLSGQQRPAGQVAAKVEEPAVIPNGFDKTQTAKAALEVRNEGQQQVEITPLSYVAAKAGEDVRVTRWFNHQ